MLEVVGGFVPSVFLQWWCDQLGLGERDGDARLFHMRPHPARPWSMSPDPARVCGGGVGLLPNGPQNSGLSGRTTSGDCWPIRRQIATQSRYCQYCPYVGLLPMVSISRQACSDVHATWFTEVADAPDVDQRAASSVDSRRPPENYSLTMDVGTWAAVAALVAGMTAGIHSELTPNPAGRGTNNPYFS